MCEINRRIKAEDDKSVVIRLRNEHDKCSTNAD